MSSVPLFFLDDKGEFPWADVHARLSAILNSLENTISHTQKGISMRAEIMFAGLNREEWEGTLKEQNEHLQKEVVLPL